MIVSGSLRIVIALLVVAALGWGFSWVASAMTGGAVSSPCSSTAPADCGNPFTNFDNYSSSHAGCSTASTTPVCRAESTATPGGLLAQETQSGATPLKPGQITRRSDTSGVTPGGIRPPLSRRNRRPFPRVGWPCGGHPGPPRSGGCPAHPRTGVYDVARQLDCAAACGEARSDPVVRRDAPRRTQAGGEHGRRPRCEPVSRGPGGTGSITARGNSNERGVAVHYPRQASCRLRGCARPVRLHLSRAGTAATRRPATIRS